MYMYTKMSVANILHPNNLELYAKNLTSPEFVKTNSINTTDPDRLLIGDNTSTFVGLDFGTLGSAATYTFNGIPFVPGSAVTSIAAPVNATDDNVLQITGTTLNAEFASATRPGVVSATTQSFLGNKTIVGNIAANNLSGTNTGDITLGAVGTVANANGASLTNQVLNLQPASFSFPGLMSTTAQGFNGDKTFQNAVIANSFVLPSSVDVTHGTIQQPLGTRLLHTAGSNSVYLGFNSGNYIGTAGGNVGIGTSALSGDTVGGNVAIGYSAGRLCNAGSNTIIGSSSGFNLTTGNHNVIIGTNSCNGTTVSNSIIIGVAAGSSLTTETNVIEISDGFIPSTGSNSINIGQISTASCYIRGIANKAVATPDGMIIIDSSTNKLGTDIYATTTVNFTPTLDIGTGTYSIRGSPGSSIPITLSRKGNTVTMTIASLLLNTQTGAAGTINITGVGALPSTYWPKYISSFPFVMQNNSNFATGVCYVTAGGLISWQLLTGGPFFTVPTGSGGYDTSFSWNIAP